MARTTGRRKCRNCRKLFQPDARNVNKQEYCSEPDCRKASKACAQKRWLTKKDNQDYFRNSDNVRRVQEWRKRNPGYWRRKRNRYKITEPKKTVERQTVATQLTQDALQDVLTAQQAVLVGLIASFTGDTLQDHIVSTTRNMQQLGQDILNSSTCFYGGDYDNKNPDQPRPDP